MGGGGGKLGGGKKGRKGELNETTAGGKGALKSYKSGIKGHLDNMAAQGMFQKSGTGSRGNVKRNLERRVVKLLSMQGKESKNMHGDFRGLLKNKKNDAGRQAIVTKLVNDYMVSNTTTVKSGPRKGKVGWKRGTRGGVQNQILAHNVHGYSGTSFNRSFRLDSKKARSRARNYIYK